MTGCCRRCSPRIHPRFGTPWISQLIIGVGVAIVAATMPIDTLSELVGAGTLFAFILVCIAVIYLRRAEPATPRPFRTPWVPWLPLAGILACLGLLAGLRRLYLDAGRPLDRGRAGDLLRLRTVSVTLAYQVGRITIDGGIAQEAFMPGKAFVMAFVWSGWLIASVIAFMIVAYASFFGIGVIGLMIWFVTARVDMEQDGVVGAGVSPAFLAQQLRTRTEMSRAERAALHGRHLLEKQSTRFFRWLGMALTAAGFGGFLLFQI